MSKLYPDAENRYQSDVDFRVLVDTMESAIRNCQYTPSEMRQAAVLACIHYEQKTLHPSRLMWNDGYDGCFDMPRESGDD